VSNASPETIRVCLRVAASAAGREAEIAAWMKAASTDGQAAAGLVLAEGLLLDRLHNQGVPVIALGTACPCCTGIVRLRVVLTRSLRERRPARVLILLTDDAHLPRLRRMLIDGELGTRFEVDG
jgi:hypothetical protein